MMIGILAAAIRRAIAPEPPVSTDRYVAFGPVASPTALSMWCCAVSGETVLVGGNSAALYLSTTAGKSWAAVTSGFGSDVIYAADFGGNRWVIVGGNGKLAVSSDGVAWTQRTSGFGTAVIYDVAYANGLWVAVGSSGMVSTSPDGVTWTLRPAGVPTSVVLRSVAYGGGKWVAVGSGGTVATSADGVTWAVATVSGGPYLTGIASDGATWVAVGSGGVILTSADASTWTSRPNGFGGGIIWSVAVADGLWVVSGLSGMMEASSDAGTTWRTMGSPFSATVTNMVCVGGLWVAAASGGQVAVGYTGEPVPVATGEYWASQGGWYVGTYSSTYMVVADAASEAERMYKTSNTDSGTSNDVDGRVNVATLRQAGMTNHPAAELCDIYRGGGFADWYLPAPNEVAFLRSNLWSGLVGVPAAFAVGGSQRFVDAFRQTSKQGSPSATTLYRMDTEAFITSGSKTNSYAVRPVRRVAMPSGIRFIGSVTRSKPLEDTTTTQFVFPLPEGTKVGDTLALWTQGYSYDPDHTGWTPGQLETGVEFWGFRTRQVTSLADIVVPADSTRCVAVLLVFRGAGSSPLIKRAGTFQSISAPSGTHPAGPTLAAGGKFVLDVVSGGSVGPTADIIEPYPAGVQLAKYTPSSLGTTQTHSAGMAVGVSVMGEYTPPARTWNVTVNMSSNRWCLYAG